MLNVIFIVVILSSYIFLVDSAFCTSEPDAGERTSDYEILDGMADLKLINSVENGKLFEAGPSNARFPIVHVYGTHYEMGYAEGLLVKEDLKKFAHGAYGYLVKSGLDALGDRLPKWAQTFIMNKGVEKALDWTAKITEPFTPKSYFDQLHGLADASGVDYQLLLRLNMMPELTKASCSFFGAWGKATASTGGSFQLRALDYVTDAQAFTDFPQLTVYHPSDGSGISHVSVAWPGVVGVLTGFSSERIGISEIGVSYGDDSFGQGTDDTPPQKVHGQPWMSVLKDVLNKATSREEAISSMTAANRTCNLIIGVGDGEENYVNGVQYSGYVLNTYADTDPLPTNDTWHAPIENVVYNGMDWDCPTYTEKLGDQLRKYWGSITDDRTVSDILPTVQTGDLHIAVYDLTNAKMSVSFCKRSTASADEPTYAYYRQFTRLDMNQIFNTPKE